MKKVLKLSKYIYIPYNEPEIIYEINGRKKMLEQFSEKTILKYYENTINKYFSLGSPPLQ